MECVPCLMPSQAQPTPLASRYTRQEQYPLASGLSTLAERHKKYHYLDTGEPIR